jgi:hypothetical protein
MVDNDRLSKLFAQGYRDVTDGQGKEKIVGYLGYFKTTRGFEKTVYMSTGEIIEHAMTYAPANYKNPKSDWNDPKHRPVMEMKTVLKELLRWADLSGKDNSGLRRAMAIESETQEWADDSNIVDAVSNPAPVPAAAPSQEPPEPPEPGDAVIKASPIQESIRAYSYLCIRADGVKVPHEPLPEHVTIDQVRAQHAELLEFVKGAEEQAKADQPALINQP